MFWFVACMVSWGSNGSMTCTTPVQTASEAECRALEKTWKASAESVERAVRIDTRCVPATSSSTQTLQPAP